MQVKFLHNLVEELAGEETGRIAEILFNKRDVNEFIIGLKSVLKDLTLTDIEQAKEIYQTEQETVKGLDWLARRAYFKI